MSFSGYSESIFSGLEFFETSAKENINVKAVFERLVDIICDKMAESLDSDPTAANVSLNVTFGGEIICLSVLSSSGNERNSTDGRPRSSSVSVLQLLMVVDRISDATLAVLILTCVSPLSPNVVVC